MKRVTILTLALLSLLLAACGSLVPGVQLDLDDQFWFGSISSGGASIPAGLGFLQTDDSVTGILGITDSYGDVITSPPMSGTIAGYELAISFNDAVGDRGTVIGTFDQSQTTFSGTLTLILDGVSTSYNLTMSYQSQLGARMQSQSVTTFRELSEHLE